MLPNSVFNLDRRNLLRRHFEDILKVTMAVKRTPIVANATCYIPLSGQGSFRKRPNSIMQQENFRKTGVQESALPIHAETVARVHPSVPECFFGRFIVLPVT